MRPSLLASDRIQAYLDAGHWTRETMVARYAAYAREFAERLACRDPEEAYGWGDLEEETDRLAARLIALGVERDARALVQMPSSCREIVLRIALKKAGIIGVFVPMQWRRREIDHVIETVDPALLVVMRGAAPLEEAAWLDRAARGLHRIDPSAEGAAGWLAWREMVEADPDRESLDRIPERRFAFDDVSLITASSGTSGLAKLCEWPEAAQLCVGRAVAARLGITSGDNVGVFAPMSGAAGLIVWLASAAAPCGFTFPAGYRPDTLLACAEEARVTIATTVPVVLARLARAPVEKFDLAALRLLRIGTAAADCEAARVFETRTGCRVVPASGSMECPGFGHAGADEPRSLRLDGSVGVPLRGGGLRIEDAAGNPLPPGMPGELKAAAPFASSGYWGDPQANATAWSGDWYATGDIGILDARGRLTLLGRIKDIINRSGHKILPGEIEREISCHPGVLDCAVVRAPDPDYGEVPWAFVQFRAGAPPDAAGLAEFLRARGLAGYKIPARVVDVAELPRIGGSKVDKTALMARAAALARGSTG